MALLYSPREIDREKGVQLCVEAGLDPKDVLAIRRFGPVVVARVAVRDPDGRMLLNRRRSDVRSRLSVRLSTTGGA